MKLEVDSDYHQDPGLSCTVVRHSFSVNEKWEIWDSEQEDSSNPDQAHLKCQMKKTFLLSTISLQVAYGPRYLWAVQRRSENSFFYQGQWLHPEHPCFHKNIQVTFCNYLILIGFQLRVDFEAQKEDKALKFCATLLFH